MYLQIYDDPESKSFTTYVVLISVNVLRSAGSETLQKIVYSENAAMTHFRMIPEPYIVPAVSPKL